MRSSSCCLNSSGKVDLMCVMDLVALEVFGSGVGVWRSIGNGNSLATAKYDQMMSVPSIGDEFQV